MRVAAAGHGQFTEVVLHPSVTVAASVRDGRPTVTDDDLARSCTPAPASTASSPGR